MATSWKIALITALVAAAVGAFIFTAQFHGEDELNVYITANWLAQAFKSFDWFTIARVIVGSYHPPGRFLMATASFLIFGASVFALRLPGFIIWVITCVMGGDITRRLAGPRAGLITGIMLGASGLFSLEAMGFGHGVLTFWVMLFIWLWIKNSRRYILGGIILALAFLWFTSVLPIIGMYHLYFAYRAIKEKNIKQYILLTLPFVLFYAMYYAVFLGVPYYAWTHGIRATPVGQLHQNLARSASAHVNIRSFVDNMRGLNWYHLPFISWFFLMAGLVGQWRRKRALFWILTPYALIFSFYITDNTLQHFLSYYIWLVPFGIAAIWAWGEKRGRDWQGAVTSLLVAACIGAAVFGYVANMRRYTEATYPYGLESAVLGSSKWRTNLMRPLPEIAADLKRLLGPKDHWTVTIDGTLPMYYFPDSRYMPFTNNCLGFRAIVHSGAQPPACQSKFGNSVRYPGSFLEIELLP